jgi:hypothetical protein
LDRLTVRRKGSAAAAVGPSLFSALLDHLPRYSPSSTPGVVVRRILLLLLVWCSLLLTGIGCGRAERGKNSDLDRPFTGKK